MRFFKIIVITLITVFAFNHADAQISVKVGGNPRHHRKFVVVERHVHHAPPHHRQILVKHNRRH